MYTLVSHSTEVDSECSVYYTDRQPEYYYLAARLWRSLYITQTHTSHTYINNHATHVCSKHISSSEEAKTRRRRRRRNDNSVCTVDIEETVCISLCSCVRGRNSHDSFAHDAYNFPPKQIENDHCANCFYCDELFEMNRMCAERTRVGPTTTRDRATLKLSLANVVWCVRAYSTSCSRSQLQTHQKWPILSIKSQVEPSPMNGKNIYKKNKYIIRSSLFRCGRHIRIGHHLTKAVGVATATATPATIREEEKMMSAKQKRRNGSEKKLYMKRWFISLSIAIFGCVRMVRIV